MSSSMAFLDHSVQFVETIIVLRHAKTLIALLSALKPSAGERKALPLYACPKLRRTRALSFLHLIAEQVSMPSLRLQCLLVRVLIKDQGISLLFALTRAFPEHLYAGAHGE